MDNGDFPLRNAACDVSFSIIFTCAHSFIIVNR